jgi:hypothetical protein
MNKFALFLFLAVMPCLFSRSLKTEDYNVYVSRPNVLFAADVSDFDRLDFANTRAVGRDGEWQELKRGRGVARPNYGGLRGRTEVTLGWQHPLDAEHWVVDYGWIWIAGSSSSSEFVQVFERRGDNVYITQEIEADTHHGGTPVGAWFNADKNLLTVKAVNYAPLEGRCCPSLMGVVTFRWDGNQFRRISAKRVPLPN